MEVQTRHRLDHNGYFHFARFLDMFIFHAPDLKPPDLANSGSVSKILISNLGRILEDEKNYGYG